MIQKRACSVSVVYNSYTHGPTKKNNASSIRMWISFNLTRTQIHVDDRCLHTHTLRIYISVQRITPG